MQSQNITGILILFATSAFAAPIQPNLVLTNFQSTADLSQASNAQFGGFEFSNDRVWWSDMGQGQPFPWLRLGGTTWLESGPGAQVLTATASVDFDISGSGWMVTGFALYGWATSSGISVTGTFGTTAPCNGAIYGSYSEGHGCSLPLGTGMSSGTIMAFLRLTGDALERRPIPGVPGAGWYDSDTATVGSPTVALWLEPATIHNPEPSTLAMMMVGAGIMLVGARLWRGVRFRF